MVADVVKLVHRCKVGSAGGRRFYKWSLDVAGNVSSP